MKSWDWQQVAVIAILACVVGVCVWRNQPTEAIVAAVLALLKSPLFASKTQPVSHGADDGDGDHADD